MLHPCRRKGGAVLRQGIAVDCGMPRLILCGRLWPKSRGRLLTAGATDVRLRWRD